MKNITKEEMGIISVVRLNRLSPKTEVTRKFAIGKLRIVYNRRSKKNLWGRFGGGWNWKIGVDVGGSTVIINLFVCSIRFCHE